MSDAIPPTDALGDAPDMTAAELALGLLDGDERAAALRRLLAERTFAVEVEAWRGHLAQLFDLWPEVTPPATALARLELSLDGPHPATAAVLSDGPRPNARSARLWQGVAGLSSLAAAALLLVLVTRPAARFPQPAPIVSPTPGPAREAAMPAGMLVAAIMPTDKSGPVNAVYDPHSGGMRLTAMPLADGRHSAELWVIAGDGVPHSLGLMHDGGTAMAVGRDNRARLAAGALLAVSLEPIGGSPTGKPTGPVVAKGALALV
ncbi:MAG: anti-sigma factor [Sphingomonas sp.]